jgi:hypothetical protein
MGVPEVEQIPALSALVKSPEFRAKQLGDGIDRHLRRTIQPSRGNGQLVIVQRMQMEVFAGVDLDF